MEKEKLVAVEEPVEEELDITEQEADIECDISPEDENTLSIEEEETEVSDDSITNFCRQAEVDYAKGQLGYYPRLIDQYPLLSPEEEKATAILVAAGDKDARTKMINSNLRLAFYWAVKAQKGYKGRTSQLSLGDLIQAANIGLIKAVDKFDPSRGTRFSTFATTRIRSEIQLDVYNNCNTIRKPVNVMEDIMACMRFIDKLTVSLGREPTPEEVEEASEKRFLAQKVRLYREDPAFAMCYSLDAKLTTSEDHSEGFCLGEIVSNTDYDEDHFLFIREERAKLIGEALKFLKPVQRAAIVLYYNLDQSGERTYEMIGKELYDMKLSKTIVCRERVRQIIELGLENLRKNPSRLKKLQELM